MIAAQSPTSFILHLPLGDCSEYPFDSVLDKQSCQELVGPSTISVHVSPRPGERGSALIPFASLLGLGAQFPHVRALHLRCVLSLQLDASPCDAQRFSRLESLTIDPWFSQLSGDADVTKYLLALFQHMPRLRALSVYAPMTRPHVERAAEDDLLYPDLPFSLEQLVCFGTLSVFACARLIAHSRYTLRDLRINIVGHADADEAALIAAIAQAAPGLRVLDLRLRGDSRLLSRVAPVFAALTRVQTLHVETPRDVPLQDTLALLAGVHARTLSIRFPHDRHDDGAALDMQRVINMLQTLRLRNLTLTGFAISVEDTRALAAHCRASRIRCSTVTFVH